MLNFEQSRESPLAYGNWYVDCSSWIPSAFHVHMTCSKYILLYENLKWLAQTYRFKLIQQYKYIYIYIYILSWAAENWMWLGHEIQSQFWTQILAEFENEI